MIKHDEKYELEKSVWTTEDFERMGWHDTKIHGISFDAEDAENFKIILDIDYIYAWVDPAPDIEYFSFWVSPCSLVFENVHDLNIDVKSLGGLEIDDVSKEANQWIIECQEGVISFESTGYAQYTRKKPIHTNRQHLEKAERGGVNFEMITSL